MPKNKVTAKLSHSTRDDLIYQAIKLYPFGISRQQLVIVTGYEINQVSSAVWNLLNTGSIRLFGSMVNPETGFNCETLTALMTKDDAPALPSRRGELKRLREQNEALTKRVKELEKRIA